MEGGGGGKRAGIGEEGYSLGDCLSYLTVDHVFLPRRGGGGAGGAENTHLSRAFAF